MTARRGLMASPAPDTDRREDWRTQANCAGTVDDWLWFDHGQRDEPKALAEARTICGPCPIRDACLDYAVRHLSLEGIFAGTTQQQRRTIARNRNRKTRAKEATS